MQRLAVVKPGVSMASALPCRRDVCRFCFQSDEEEDAGSGTNGLVSPCNCTGTQKYIHLNCLRQWQDATMDERRQICGVCKAHFTYAPPPTREEVIYQGLTQHMLPHMSYVVEAFKANATVHVESHLGVNISWDAHRITDADNPWAYLFRVRVENITPRPCPVQGLARFYVLRAPNGFVYPIHRVTMGPASFLLNSKETYQYAWIFFTKYETAEAAGGILLENRTEFAGDLEKHFLRNTLAPLKPARAENITFKNVQSLVNRYDWMGALDLTHVDYIQEMGRRQEDIEERDSEEEEPGGPRIQ